MTKLIKFPSHITPSRVTIELVRTDERFVSPATGIQQVATRGNAFWKWSFEYRDLSLSERDVVQAFLAKCQGPINNFKVGDPANYTIPGDVSTWTDMISNYGSFAADTNSGSSAVNSHFLKSNRFTAHVTDDGMVRMEWRERTSTSNLQPKDGYYKPNILEAGKMYYQRIKHFPSIKPAHTFTFQVGSRNVNYLVQSFPSDINSAGCFTAPFFMGTEVSSFNLGIVDWNFGAVNAIGDYFYYADYRLARCALVSNSENLLTWSENFAHANWTIQNANISSGGETGPNGIANAAWKFFVDATVNSHHNLIQSYTKANTEDIYTASIKAKAAEKGELILRLDGGSSAQYAQAVFWLNSGTVGSPAVNGDFIRPFAKIWDIGSGWYRCQVSAVVNSNNQVRLAAFVASGTGFQITGNGSDGIWIADSQIAQFPFMRQYCKTQTNALVGSNYQTGSALVIDGLDPETKIKAGTRLEVVTRYHNVSSATYEMSEFKRVTEEAVVQRDGNVVLEIDPPIRKSPQPTRSYRQQAHLGETVHNPVIFSNPEMKARLSGSSINYTERPLQMFDVNFEVVEDLTE